jgi:hypothetical protein
VLIGRCAWHRRYYGVGRLLGVSSWRGLRIGFSDGICPKCAARVRSDLRISRARGRVAADRRPWMPGLALVAAAVMIAVLLVARPTHEMPAPTLLASRPPAAPGPASPEPEPAASPALAAPAARAAHPLRAAPPSRRPVVLRDVYPVSRALPRPTVGARTHPPRDSTQAP